MIGEPTAPAGMPEIAGDGTGNFYVMVPVRVDWLHGQVTAGQRCLATTGKRELRETGCEMQVEARPVAMNTQSRSIRLFPLPTDNNEVHAEHAVLTRNSKVEFLKAKAVVNWDTNEDLMQIVFDNVWLKVHVDIDGGNDGWIHTDEDFGAVGLPSGS